MKQSGFTLAELLILIALLAILASAAGPALSAQVQAHKRLVAAQQLAAGIRAARVAAITRHQWVSIQAIDDDWSQGWRIIAERNGARPDDPLLAERALDGQVRIVGNTKVAQRLTFGALGGLRGSGNGTLHVCLKGEAVSHYRVVVAATGQVRVEGQQVEQRLCGA